MIKKLLFAGHIRFKAHKLKAFQCSNSDSYCTTVRTVKTILGCFVQLDGVSRRGPYAHRIRLQYSEILNIGFCLCPSRWYLRASVLYFSPPETGFYRPPGRQERLGACPCNQYAAIVKVCSMSWLGRHMGQHHDHVSQFSSCLAIVK
jgi:hypothetical protein